jgi:hypothetical protein
MAAPAPPYNTGVPAQPVYPPPQPAGQAQQVPPPVFYDPPAPIGSPSPTKRPTLPPRHLPPLPDQPVGQPTPPVPPVQPAPASARTVLAPARLVVAASGAALALPNSAQALIGRADKVSNFYPDIDLIDHGALDGGVGRRHLRLAVQNGQVVAEDMDSTNGTMINGQKLAPRQPHPLHDGDTIQLGKLILRLQL